jgi:phosphomannomutase/phosphoglucomutase
MAKSPAAPSSTRAAQYTLTRIALRGGVVGLLAVVACYVFLLVYDLPAANQERQRQASAELAQTQAQLVEHWLGHYRQRLRAAAADPRLQRAIEQGQPASALPDSTFADAHALRVVPLGPLGIAGLDAAAAGLRNNIEIDMLRRAAGGEADTLESYSLDGARVIALSEPVAIGQNVIGALLLTLPAQHLTELLARHLGERGSSELLQQVGGQPRAVLGAGRNSGGPAIEAPLKLAGWQLRVTPATGWLESMAQSPLPLSLALALSCAGVLLGCLISAREFRSALERNLRIVVTGGQSDLPGFSALREALTQASASAARRNHARPAEPGGKPEPAPEPEPELELVEELAPLQLPAAIFRAYDIRGIASEQLGDEIVYQLGLAIGSEALERGQQRLVVARDGRLTSEAISAALVRGLQDSGRDVIDIGLAPTPLLYFATHQLGTQSGVMVTGSHNRAEYNGLKIVLGGHTLAGRAIQALKERIEAGNFSSGRGGYQTEDVIDSYIDYLVNDVAIAQPLKVVIDAGNGVTGLIAPRLFESLGCEVVPLHCDLDGRFPNHAPDPTVEANLRDLVRAVQEHGADLGVAFDGDGDRVGVVSASGLVLPADRLLMLLAQDVVSRNPGADVLFDVKCTRALNGVIAALGGRPIMWKSGHSYMKEMMQETGALLGGEFSGHIFFNERWFGFDDGMYAAARLIEILSTTDPSLDNQLASLPAPLATPEIRVAAGEQAKFDIVERFAAEARFDGGKPTTLDGIRVDFPDGWGLLRASNTEPAITLRFEGDDEAALERILGLFRRQLAAIDPQLDLNF